MHLCAGRLNSCRSGRSGGGRAVFFLLPTDSTTPQVSAPTTDSYQAGYDQAMADAEARLEERGLIQQDIPTLESGIQQYAGQVVAVSPSVLTISYSPMNPLQPTETKTFTITDQTKIERMVAKDMAQYEAEAKAWQATLADLDPETMDEPMNPAVPFVYETISANDFSEGAIVIVQVENDALTSITLQPTISPPDINMEEVVPPPSNP
jgi:hypothetical protein